MSTKLGKDQINFAIEAEARDFAARCEPPGEVERKTYEVVTWGVHPPGKCPTTIDEALPAWADESRTIDLCQKILAAGEQTETLRADAQTLLASIAKRQADEQRRWKAEMDAEDAAPATT